MTITIRDLLFRVAPFRPDIDSAMCLMALEESAREVARETGLATELQSPVVLSANTITKTITPSTGYDLMRVSEIRIANIPYNQSITTQYLGTWNASTNTPTLASGAKSGGTVVSSYAFYIVSTAGTTSIDSTALWSVGDVVYNQGNVWKKLAREEYYHCNEVSAPSFSLAFDHPQQERGFPSRFSQENGELRFYPPPSNDTSIEVRISVIPQKDFDSVSFPQDAYNALVYGAIEFAMNLPGSGQNLKLADMYRVRFKKEISNLRAVALLGYGGSPFYQPANFTGRTGRLSSWRQEGLWL